MRLFLGIPVPELDLAGAPDVQNELHLTLAFLGEVDESLEPSLGPRVSEGLDSIAPFRIAFEGVGAFPSARAPGVVWVGVGDGANVLRKLAFRLRTHLRASGFVLEDRPFVPHVTLFRVRTSATRLLAQELLKGWAGRTFGETLVGGVNEM